MARKRERGMETISAFKQKQDKEKVERRCEITTLNERKIVGEDFDNGIGNLYKIRGLGVVVRFFSLRLINYSFLLGL